MEEEKLIRRKKKALNGSNKRVYADACNYLATFYYKHNRYSDALDEYKNETAVYEQLGLRMEWGTSNRMVAEMYMLLGDFQKSLKCEEKHLAVARELEDLVEEQRAMATLGRIYLLQGQSTTDNVESKDCLKAAERAFMKSLALCENLNGKVNKHELMDMRARLLLNIGVVQEYLGNYTKAHECFQKAISLCCNQDIYDVLHQCYMTEATVYSNKQKEYCKALNCLNKALEVASRLDDKVAKQCETLSCKGEILCNMSDYQSAKQVWLKAWKLKTPDEEEKDKIESNLKVVAAMCYIEDSLIVTDPTNHVKFKKLYEKLGDGACHLNNYASAVEYYLKMLEHAEKAGDCGKALIPIYVSLYQTYKDMGAYNEALVYYEKEYNLISDIPKEAFTTLYNIAETLYLAKKPYDEVEKACLKAREAAQNWNKRKYEIRILKCLMKYQEDYFELEKIEETKAELKALGFDDFDNLDNSDDEQSSAGGYDEDTTNIGDDICLDDLTDLSGDDEDVAEPKSDVRKRGRSYAIKKNMKGETQLHLACISGNKLLVERLLAKGHPVNIRDNAGWLPLHEACNNGYFEVANILINNGANVNDRGGSNCDGITPLYDASGNGHLEVVQLLLDKGAIPSLKTDFGETPLQALQKWRTSNILDSEQEALYKNICIKISTLIDKSNTVGANLNRSKSKTPVKPINNTTPPSTSKVSMNIKQLNTPAFKRRNIIDVDSDEDAHLSHNNRNETAFPCDSNESSDDCESVNGKDTKGVKEYRSAISALRNRNTTESPEEETKKFTLKTALLKPEEVDTDEWLDDDLGINKGKKRKLNHDPLTVVSKRPSYGNIKHTIDNINNFSEPLLENNSKTNVEQTRRKSSMIDSSENSSDTEEMKRNENISPKNRSSIESMRNITKELTECNTHDSRKNMKKRWKTQSTLLKAGFHRTRENDFDYCSSSNSDNEFQSAMAKSHRNLNSSLPKRKSDDKVNSNNNYQCTDKFNILQNINPNLVKSLNIIQPISIVQPAKGGKTLTQIMPPAAVKVQVQDKTLLISLKLESINRQKISWLVDEVKSRYYKLTGMRPVFTLTTSDGAILSEDDPLSLVLSSPELKTHISTWKPSPTEERYLSCCEALGISPSQEIQHAVERSNSTHRLALGTKTLTSIQMRPLFRALTHQAHITAIMISNNNLADDGVKYLMESLSTLKNITLLDISNNNVTNTGIKMLLNLFEKSNRPVCQSLEHLDVSLNPIGDEGFRHICSLGQFIKLKVLKANDCRISMNLFNASNKPSLNFDRIEVLDLSNNLLQHIIVSAIIVTLNPNLIAELDLENVGVDGKIVGVLSTFLDSAKQLKLRRLNISNSNLVDGQFMRIYRSLGRASNIQTIILKNNNITFITLKKLLQRQPPIPQLNLEGCHDIFKYSQDSDFHIWLPAIDFGRCIPEINVTPVSKSDAERESLKSFQNIWLNCFKGRGIIEHVDGRVVRFTAR